MHKVRKIASFLLVVLAPVLLPVSSGSMPLGIASLAQSETVRNTPEVTKAVRKRLSKAQKFAERAEFAKASELLANLLDDEALELNSFELAVVFNLQAYVAYSTNKMDRAATLYEQVLVQSNLPYEWEANTLYTLGKLHIARSAWSDAIAVLAQWEALGEEATPDFHRLMAQSYYGDKDFSNALVHLEQAIEADALYGRAPNHKWHNLARYLYTETGDYDGAIRVMVEVRDALPAYSDWARTQIRKLEALKAENAMTATEPGNESPGPL